VVDSDAIGDWCGSNERLGILEYGLLRRDLSGLLSKEKNAPSKPPLDTGGAPDLQFQGLSELPEDIQRIILERIVQSDRHIALELVCKSRICKQWSVQSPYPECNTNASLSIGLNQSCTDTPSSTITSRNQIYLEFTLHAPLKSSFGGL
jgi:hypothetical protein